MTEEKIALLVDSASDVPEHIFTHYQNIVAVPMQLMIDGKTYADRETIEPDDFYRLQSTAKELPKTASPVMGDVINRLATLKNRGFTHVIGITISGALSVTNSLFKQVAESQSGVKMVVIDTKNIGVGSGLFASYAESLINQQLPFTTIIDKLNASVPKSSVYIYIPTLKYLRAGGRIGRVSGFFGAALNIKPIITCDSDGVYTAIAKARTEKKAVQKMVELASQKISANKNARVAVAQGLNEPLLKQVTGDLQNRFPSLNIETGNISPALGVHTGPGLVGIAVKVG